MTPIPQHIPSDNSEPGPEYHGESQPEDSDDELESEEELPTARLTGYDDISVTTSLEHLLTAQSFISALKEATLDADSGLNDVARERLKDPIRVPVDLDHDPNLRAGIDLFINTTNASDDTYNSTQASMNAYLERLGINTSENSIPSLHSVKQSVAELTGIHSMMHDMCVDTCVAFTGPYAGLSHCPECGKFRYNQAKFDASNGRTKVPVRQFHTIPLGPQLQALWRNSEGARAMRHRVTETEKILEALRAGQDLNEYKDIYSGSDYLDAVQSGKIKDDDMVLMMSIDGAQLFENKQSDCWIYIWVVMDLSPDKRYKKRYVLPGGFIPGPNKPKNVDSFLFPGLHHACAISKEGIKVWDADQKRTFTSRIFLFLACADSPGMAYLNGLTGHSGAYGCRLYCSVKGRRKTNGNHYYPALLKPLNFSVPGSDHADVEEAKNLSGGNESEYLESLERLLSAHNQTQYLSLRRDTGISKPSIFSGFPPDRCLGVPGMFGGDLMHLISLNITDLLLSLWRGTMDCDPTDDKKNWPWRVLKGTVWKEHGKRVAEATKYLPGSFDRPPRNPVNKISSGYKAWEFLTYVYGLGPGLYYHVLPRDIWKSFCKLVRGVRILHQNSITSTQLENGHRLLIEFVQEFEEQYYQRREDRIHFVRQSIHALLHIAPEVTRIGPGMYYTQWCMERMIGILGQELRQPSNPYQNLSERGLRRARINALQNIIQDIQKRTFATSLH